jgi:hypothetical protein
LLYLLQEPGVLGARAVDVFFDLDEMAEHVVGERLHEQDLD